FNEIRRLEGINTALLEALEKAMEDAWYNKPSNIERIEPEWIVQARAAIKVANASKPGESS
ncbi:hypothetical protein LCGC14_2147840, partial [marine sediment metagenome]